MTRLELYHMNLSLKTKNRNHFRIFFDKEMKYGIKKSSS